MASMTLSQSKGKDKGAKKQAPTQRAASSKKKESAETKPKNGNKKPPPNLRIIPEYCKGCGICVTFCPTQVLGMKADKVVILNLDACTRCTFCELRCPDFAIYVED